MLHYIDRENRDHYREPLEQMWHQRHQIFVERLGWTLDTVNMKEMDQFDHADTRYVLYINEKGDVEGGFRLLPSHEPHLMSDVFPGLCAYGVPRGDTIWEISRFYSVTARKFNLGKNRSVDSLMVGLMEYGMMQGIKQYTFVVSTPMFPLVLRSGWDVAPLGLPTVYENDIILAFSLYVNERSRTRILDNTRMDGSVFEPSSLGGALVAA